MNIDFNTEKLKKVLLDFHNLSGIDIDIVQSDFTTHMNIISRSNPFCRAVQSCPGGYSACFKSDMRLLENCKATKKPQTCICHAGLIDIVVPVIFDREIICYLILGQMRKEEDFKKIKPLLQRFCTDSEIDFEKLYYDLKFFDESKMDSVMSIAQIVAKHILTEDFLVMKRNSKLDSAISFINHNFSHPLTVNELSKELHISKSSLYEMFHKSLGSTVNEYINSVRIQNACKLLKKTDLPIEEISRQTGFSKASYFTRVFKNIMKITPLKYRKSQV